MSTETQRPNPVLALFALAVTAAVGAHLSAVPLFLIKVVVSTLLVGLYAFFAVRFVTALEVESVKARQLIGLALGLGTVYLTWAIRIPAFSGWEVPFSADPQAIFAAIVDRAGSMEISKAFGSGTSTEGPSWLLLGTYGIEACAFVVFMLFGAVLSSPPSEEEEVAPEEPAKMAA